MARLLHLLALICTLLAVVFAKEEKQPKLKIGITKKIPSNQCKIKVKKGDEVAVHYTGKLAADNSKFDSSYDRGTPLDFPVGAGRMIAGFDMGVKSMCLGEKRRLHIPSHLGYGKTGAGGVIPPNADLIFEVEMVQINDVKLGENEDDVDDEQEEEEEETEKDL